MVYVPTLNWVGLPLKEIVIPLALILNVVTSISALLVYSKSKLVDWEGGTVMAGAALLMAPLGAFLSRSSPVKFLLVLFEIGRASCREKSVDLGGRRIIKKIFFFQAEDGIRDRP